MEDDSKSADVSPEVLRILEETLSPESVQRFQRSLAETEIELVPNELAETPQIETDEAPDDEMGEAEPRLSGREPTEILEEWNPDIDWPMEARDEPVSTVYAPLFLTDATIDLSSCSMTPGLNHWVGSTLNDLGLVTGLFYWQDPKAKCTCTGTLTIQCPKYVYADINGGTCAESRGAALEYQKYLDKLKGDKKTLKQRFGLKKEKELRNLFRRLADDTLSYTASVNCKPKVHEKDCLVRARGEATWTDAKGKKQTKKLADPKPLGHSLGSGFI